jgi:hypothetical protein
MPEVIPALIAFITANAPAIGAISGLAGAATAGVGLGENLANKPGTPAVPTAAPAVTDANAQQTAMNQRALVGQQLPTLEQQTGGSLSPDTLIQLAQLISGQAGTPGISGATQPLLNQIQAGSTNTTPQTSGLTNSTFG